MSSPRGGGMTAKNPAVYNRVLRDLGVKDPMQKTAADQDLQRASREFESARRELRELARG